ncbi:MAG: Fic family protein [Synergistaceae bacterium]|jgi:Fic family protein|nr:Fic family protein [Synergistaceae bacterium]
MSLVEKCHRYEEAIKLWRSYRVATEADIDHRLENFRILFAYNSSKIENDAITYSDTREIFENGRVLNYTGSPRAMFELFNQRTCYAFLKPKLASKEPLTIALIKEIHGVLTGGTYDERRYVELGERPGEFKKHDYVTGIAEVGSLPEDVESDLAELLDELADYGDKNEDKNRNTLKAAAYFHARFEYIHPFADGNGRVGRTLLNYYLMIHDHPPVIIYDEDKLAYYDALSRYDEDEDLAPMTAFLKRQTERTWNKALERGRQCDDNGNGYT